MSMWDLIALVTAGGVGAGARYAVDAAVMRGRTDAFPLGILLVNVSGSLALGFVLGLGALVSPEWGAIIGVGLLGGFTTFSAVSVDAVLLAQRGRRDWALINLVATAALAVVGAATGMVVGGLLPQ
ncbi:CrcB family protein [Microbacterium sp. zg.Y625]|uniref:fluoride efflux transporter FluC n=1 Tax=Microbacterium jiangjiandongii TaxID=3049071 RepID=UPI00214AC37E|nr:MULTISPECIES: CrcB family protein [unclassified Microbacterium]MCR2794127.1 CrcB family protein [Microbacterium sp. zg.Y625]WIM25578.1 CrcB family protein [Microbacterium sp. zg-Y625]